MLRCLSIGMFAVLFLESALAAAEPMSVSGRYPHLALFNQQGECGVGAVVPWQGRLWVITYAPHKPTGSDDKLYEIDEQLRVTARAESVGGTPAGRMIHEPTQQLLIGPYLIDAERRIRALDPKRMPGRLTAIARHLSEPDRKAYYFTMEEGLYEVDLLTGEPTELFPDGNRRFGTGNPLLPGYHGKGAWTSQGRLVVANNGEPLPRNQWLVPGPAGCLASWEGKSRDAKSWNVVARTQFTEVTGPAGLAGGAENGPLWTLGWDHRSVLLMVLNEGEWARFRLPKFDESYDGRHGWHTEWPRIRQVGPNGEYLLNMHGGWFELPGDFKGLASRPPRPLGSYLKITGDFARWRDQVVFGCDDVARIGNPLAGQSQSNLWFAAWDDLRHKGRPSGWGGVFVHDDLAARTASDPYLIAGLAPAALHLMHGGTQPTRLRIEAANEMGLWRKVATIEVPPKRHRQVPLDPADFPSWLRLVAEEPALDLSACIHAGHAGGATLTADDPRFAALAKVGDQAPVSLGLIRPRGGNLGTLHFAAWTQSQGKVEEAGYYELSADLKLRRVANADAHTWLKDRAQVRANSPRVEIDAASVLLIEETGRRWRLPKGSPKFDREGPLGPPRSIREVVTERSLLNVAGTFFVLPRPSSGGVARMKPVCTHNRQLHDFCSWRGLTVLSGCRLDAKPSAHFLRADDQAAGLWVGDVDDLWSLGPPRGVGGPWKDTRVAAGKPSDPYLATGYARKQLALSHHRGEPIEFTLEIDFLGDGSWTEHARYRVPPGETIQKDLDDLSAKWLRFRVNRDAIATATLRYESAVDAGPK